MIKHTKSDAPIAEKVAHVKRSGQTRRHTCHWPGCRRQVPPAMWGCREHWYALPVALRNKVWRAYQPGQEERLDPSDEYLDVAHEVETWICSQRAAHNAEVSPVREMGPVYVASSWSNDGDLLNGVHAALNAAGIRTLDFRAQGRWWSETDGKHALTGRLRTPAGVEAFEFDMDLMRRSEGCFAVHPCGIATALEAGHFAGAGKPLVVWGTPRPGGLDITWQMGLVMIGEPLSAAVVELVRLLEARS